jgi:hypothetical protein
LARAELPQTVYINFVAKEIWMPFEFVTHRGMVKEKALIDSRANENCIDIQTVYKLEIKPQLLPRPMGIRNVDGTENCGGWIKHWLPIAMFQGSKARMLRFLIIDLGRDRIIFGYPWFQHFNPDIDWPRKLIKGPPFLAADTMIDPFKLKTHARQFTRKWYLKPNRRALIAHLPTEYKDNLEETPKEQQARLVMQIQFRTHTPPQPSLVLVAKLKAENHEQ